MIHPHEALQRLQEGNARFQADDLSRLQSTSESLRKQLAGGQKPFAAILGCADSRAPVEPLFDQGLGDLFVVRVAGNFAGPSQVGSLEYAAAVLGARLFVVLGHTRCGAVSAAVEEAIAGDRHHEGPLRSILDSIHPALDPVLQDGQGDLVQRAVRANVAHAAEELRHGSAVIEKLIAEEELLVVGAEYCLDSGAVEFFDGMPAGSA